MILRKRKGTMEDGILVSIHHKEVDSTLTSQKKQTLQRVESLFRTVSVDSNLINLCIDITELRSYAF